MTLGNALPRSLSRPGHLGGTLLALDSNGERDARLSYYPFGATRSSGGYGPLRTGMKFTGQRLDGNGLYYYGARYYDPDIGRFISPDPLGARLSHPQELNRYSYVVNNPLRYTDPTGLAFFDPSPRPNPPTIELPSEFPAPAQNLDEWFGWQPGPEPTPPVPDPAIPPGPGPTPPPSPPMPVATTPPPPVGPPATPTPASGGVGNPGGQLAEASRETSSSPIALSQPGAQPNLGLILAGVAVIVFADLPEAALLTVSFLFPPIAPITIKAAEFYGLTVALPATILGLDMIAAGGRGVRDYRIGSGLFRDD